MTKLINAVVAGSVLALCAGCGSDDPAASTETPRYAVSGVVFGDDDTSMTYVSLLPSLDDVEIDYKQSTEFPGRASIATTGGWLFVGGGEEQTIRRYKPLAGGKLEADGALGFGNYELDSIYIDAWGNTFVDEHKAYLQNSVTGPIVWDPTDLRIIKQIETPELERDEALSIDGSPGVVRGNRLYRTFFWKNWEEYETLPEQYLAVFDLEQDTLAELVPESRCPSLNNQVSEDEQGNLYFSNWVYNVTETLGRGAPKSCALRLSKGSDAFDADWQLTFSDVTDGREAAALNYLGENKGFITTFYSENVEIDDSTDLNDLAQSPNWRLWGVDLDEQTASPLEGLDWLAGGYATQKVDDRTFVLVPSNEYDKTTVYEITLDGKVEQRFEVLGFAYQLLKL